MSISAIIKSIEPLYIQKDDKTVLDVAVEFVQGKKVVGTKQLQFEVGTLESEIRSDVAGHAHEFQKELTSRADYEKKDKAEAATQKETATLRKNLIDKEIEPKEKVVKTKS